MIMTIDRDITTRQQLSEQEEKEVVRNLSLLRSTLDIFPQDSLTRQSKIDDWAKLEKWALLAMQSVSELMKRLGPIQTRSPETEKAFHVTLSAFDIISDVVEHRFRDVQREDFVTANAALERCFATVHRLV